MHTLYVLIVYIIHNGAISDGMLFPVVNLYASVQKCTWELKALKLGANQQAICAPVGGIEGPAGCWNRTPVARLRRSEQPLAEHRMPGRHTVR